MTKTAPTEPWHALSPALADAIEPELPAATEEILETIGREVPEYARPLEGAFGVAIRTGVTEALRQFVELIRDPAGGREPGRDVYVGLGRAEHREGRTLDRSSPPTAWARGSPGAASPPPRVRRGADPEQLGLLAEAIFAYIDELSADSVEGYAQAQREQEGERQRRRRELLELLLRDPPAARRGDPLGGAGRGLEAGPKRRAARRRGGGPGAGRPPPPGGRAGRERGRHRLRARVLTAHRGAEAGDARHQTAALGPTVPRAELAGAWSLAVVALRAVEAGAIEADGPLYAEEHLAALLLFDSGGLAERLRAKRLAPLDDLTPAGRARMEETALAYVQHGGNAAAMARALHLHPQTIRYRLGRLRELFGDELADPDARFELELALRSVRSGRSPAARG